MNYSLFKLFWYIVIATLINSQSLSSQSINKIEGLVTKCKNGEKKACDKLITIAKKEENPQSQCEAIHGIADQNVLIDIVDHTNNRYVLFSALDKISDQHFLIEFASKHIDEVGLYALRNINDLEISKILLSKFIKKKEFNDNFMSKDIKYHDFFAFDFDPKLWAYEPVLKKYFKKLTIDIPTKEYEHTYKSYQDGKIEKFKFTDYKLIVKDCDQVIFSHSYESEPPNEILFTGNSVTNYPVDPFYGSRCGINAIVDLILSRIPESEYLYVYENLVSHSLQKELRENPKSTNNLYKVLVEPFFTVISPPLVNNGLISYYTFDDNDNSITTDFMKKYNGFGGGSASTDIPGKGGYSMQFSYDAFTISHAFISKNNPSWTLSFWIKTCSNNFIIYCQDDTSKSNRIAINNENKLEIQSPINGSFSIDLSEHLLNSKWHMLSIEYDSSKESCGYFIDGQFQEIMNIPMSWEGISATIGCNFDHSDFFFVGNIDNIRFYNRILTQIEIMQIYIAKQ